MGSGDLVKRVHRFACLPSPAEKEELRRMGLPARGSAFSVVLDEADPRLKKLSTWCSGRACSHLQWTEFTDEEVAQAEWVQVLPTWQSGYPQPDNDFGYIGITYDGAKACSLCGIGYTQRAPFRFKGEPRWGAKDVLQVHWVGDEYFTRPAVWDAVFRPHGIEALPVLGRSGKHRLESVVQLVVSEVQPVSLPEGSSSSVCPQCRATKYAFHDIGVAPSFLVEPKNTLVKSREWFGDGGEAFRAVYASAKLARAIAGAKLRGLRLRPAAARVG